jgi:glutaredoxin 3
MLPRLTEEVDRPVTGDSGTVNESELGDLAMTKAVLFSTATCPWCSRAKRYLKDKGVSVKELNVERDAQDMVNKTGQMGVPVIKIGSEW